jgi:GMP synthase-like glutamine amidotransferase
MDVLSIVHSEHAGTELFASVIEGAGHRHTEWRFAADGAPPAADAVLVYGGAMHPDQEDRHEWLRDELAWLRGLIESEVPTLGICLGSQLIARATGAWVGPLAAPEIGWHEVALTDAAASDPVLSSLPSRFEALEWHHYGHELSAGAVELARNSASLQGFRLGDACWGVQFHPEVTGPQLERWITDKTDLPPDPEGLRQETREKIGAWNELGSRLCNAFLVAAASRVAEAA